MPRNPCATRRQPKPTTDLDKYDGGEDLEIQNRGMLPNRDGTARMILYAWLSDKRKEQNRQPWCGKYCPFDEKEKVSKTVYGEALAGRITAISRDYYGGDCLVLYVDLDKKSSRKWLDRRAKTQAA